MNADSIDTVERNNRRKSKEFLWLVHSLSFFFHYHISPSSDCKSQLFEDFFFFFFSFYKWILFLSPKPGLSPVRDTALGLCSMSESRLSVRLWKPDNPLMESTSGYCCLCPPPSLQHIWRFIEGEGWAAGACANMAGHDGNRKGGRKNRGRRETHQGVMGTPLTCLWRMQCSGRAGPWLSSCCRAQIMMGLLCYPGRASLRNPAKIAVKIW